MHNSLRRGWLVAILGAVLVAVSLDLLVWNRLVAGLAELVYQGEEVLEARERVWAAIMGAAGAVLIGWGAISGVRWRPVLAVGPEGLHVALRGPLRPLDLLPWESIEQIFPQPVSDGGSLLSSLTIVLRTDRVGPRLPTDPWGARWTGKRILRVLASDWSVRAEAVSTVSNHYLDLMRQPPQATDLG